MIRVDPFDPADVAAMTVQPAQAAAGVDWAALARANHAAGPAFTARAADGRVLLCGGAVEVHAGYATLWSVLAADAGPYLLALTRRVRWFVEKLPHARIDAHVRGGHREGRRWMRSLGFAREARLHQAFPDGADAIIFRWRGRGG